jgi:hypothetical protein
LWLVPLFALLARSLQSAVKLTDILFIATTAMLTTVEGLNFFISSISVVDLSGAKERGERLQELFTEQLQVKYRVSQLNIEFGENARVHVRSEKSKSMLWCMGTDSSK